MRKKSEIFQKTTLFTILLSQISFSAYASLKQKSSTQDSSFKPQIEIGEIDHGGNGCPSGSSPVLKSPKFDQKIVFKPLQYRLETGKNKKRIARKSCQLSIPIKVPRDISISFDQLNFKGNLDLEKGSSLRFSAEYFIAGKKGPQIKTTFKETKIKSFQISPKENTPPFWSACGESVNLRINTSLFLRSKGTSAGTAALESIQLGKNLVGAIKWKKCP